MNDENQASTGYLGSVKFFRHVIVGFVLLAILVLTCSTVVLTIRLASAEAKLQEMENTEQDLAGQDAGIQSEQSLNLKAQAAPQFSSMQYQSLYPEMVSNTQYLGIVNPKTVYLTFDDGPSDLTGEILDVLKSHGIHATFFLVGNQINESNMQIVKRISEEGHSIGVHSTTHKYTEVYQSVENFLSDFHTTYQKIYDITGSYPEIFRFPGGSINQYNLGNYKQIISEMLRRGFLYFDWNVSAQDAAYQVSANQIRNNILKGMGFSSNIVVLMHERSKTLQVLDDIIQKYEQNGFAFDKLSKQVKSISFSYKTGE